MGLQATGGVADSEIRTKNKPPAGPLFVDLSEILSVRSLNTLELGQISKHQEGVPFFF